MITIDGSFGEGGGQILRSCLSLSLVTGKPFHIHSIRAGRRKPGLARQHLTAVNAAAGVGGSEVRGNTPGSTSVYFSPGVITPGHYRFDTGSAGSGTLVLQTVMPALLMAGGDSEVTVKGGTHNPWAPPFDFLARVFLPIINKMGPNVAARMERPGFYPAGGGKFTVWMKNTGTLNRVEVMSRGELVRQSARAVVSKLPEHICRREVKRLKNRLGWEKQCFSIESIPNPVGPGNVVMVEVQSTHVTEVFTGFGRKGIRAEQVADTVAKQVTDFLASEAPVGRYLADQLLLPMALAGGGRFRTVALSEHTRTNMEVMKQFLDIRISAEQQENGVWEIGLGMDGS